MRSELPPSASRAWSPRAIGWLVVRLAVAVGVLGFTLSRLPMGELVEAIANLEPLSFALAVGLMASGNVLGAVRWRFAMIAFGATNIPSLAELTRVYFVGTFFNTYVPGGLGGDVLRAGIAHRTLGNPTAAWLSVLTERALGLAGLFTVVGVTIGLTDPFDGIPATWFLLAGGVIAVGCGLAPVLLRPIARHYGLGEPAALPLLGAWIVSLFAHLLIASVGYLTARSVSAGASWLDALAVVPLAQASVFFPATVGGLGVREAAFVELYTRVGIPETPAAAAAFAYLGVTLLAAGIGGVVHVAWPSVEASEPSPRS